MFYIIDVEKTIIQSLFNSDPYLGIYIYNSFITLLHEALPQHAEITFQRDKKLALSCICWR